MDLLTFISFAFFLSSVVSPFVWRFCLSSGGTEFSGNEVVHFVIHVATSVNRVCVWCVCCVCMSYHRWRNKNKINILAP